MLVPNTSPQCFKSLTRFRNSSLPSPDILYGGQHVNSGSIYKQNLAFKYNVKKIMHNSDAGKMYSKGVRAKAHGNTSSGV